MKLLLSLAGGILLNYSCFSQITPVDLISRLPVVYTGVCVSGHEEVQAYSALITEFSRTVQHQIDSLAPLKIRSRDGRRVNTGADNSELFRELEKARRSVTSYDFASAFEKAVDDNVVKEKQQKMDEIIRKMGSATDERETEKLLDEVHKVMVEYCKNATGRFIELLIGQRTLLRTEIDAVVRVDDILQQIECNSYGYTYYPALSYEKAYILILDHLKYMHQLLSFSPGNE